MTRRALLVLVLLSSAPLARADDRARPRGRIVEVVHEPPDAVPSIGPLHAPVTIELFANLGDRAQSYTVYRWLLELHERHPRRLRILFRLIGAAGEQSNPTIEAALEAFAQGRFREFVDAVYGAQRGSPGRGDLAAAAREAGVDPRLIDEALADGRHLPAIRASYFLRKRRRIKRPSPVLVANGVPYDKRVRTLDELEAIYDEAYARGKALLDDGLPLEALYPRLLEDSLAELPEPSIGPGWIDGLGPGERPPIGPAASIAIVPSVAGDGGHPRGPEGAPVAIHFFCNLETRNCGTTAQVLDEIAAAYPDEVQVVFHDLFDRLDARQAHAPALGVAAECADRQGRFWSFYDLALRRAAAGEVTDALAGELPKSLELDLRAFARCSTSRDARARLERSSLAARAAGVRHTPSIVLGGRLYTGTRSFDELAALIDRELAPGVIGRLAR